MPILWFNNFFLVLHSVKVLHLKLYSWHHCWLHVLLRHIVSGLSDHDVAAAMPIKRMLASADRQTKF